MVTWLCVCLLCSQPVSVPLSDKKISVPAALTQLQPDILRFSRYPTKFKEPMFYDMNFSGK